MTERPDSTPITLHIKNLRALRDLQWTLQPGVNVLVAANGKGKTTLLHALSYLRWITKGSTQNALSIAFGGPGNLRSTSAPERSPVELKVSFAEVDWQIDLLTLHEDMLSNDDFVFTRQPNITDARYVAEGRQPAEQAILQNLYYAHPDDPDLSRFVHLFRRIVVLHDPDLWGLREGSRSTDDPERLHSRGQNALTLLRRWAQERPHRHRYAFVVESLQAAFPDQVHDLDFQEAGQTLVVRIYPPGTDQPLPLATAANGFLQLLVLLVALASAEPGGIVAIDEPENGLHPFAIRRFMESAESWTEEHQIALILTTHSPVLLNCMKGKAERVFTLHAEQPPAPQSLADFASAEWLRQFDYGDLYSSGELGSNDEG